METTTKETVATPLTSTLNEAITVRNKVGKTYHYVATISNYKSATNYTKAYHNVSDLTGSSDKFDYKLNTDYLNKLKVGEILEIKVSFKLSNNYSLVSHTFLVATNNTDDEIQFQKFDTAFKAFKFVANIINKI